MARKPEGLTVTRDEISQSIDLKKWTGRDLSGEPELAREIGQAVIDYMTDRTERGVGLGGEKFQPNKYSQDYRQSAAFKAAGKKNSPVNMKLSGDMLSSIDMDATGSRVDIFVGSDQIDKAHGHMTGQEGQGPLPKRQFFGITKAEFEKAILPKFRSQLASVDEAAPKRKDKQGDLIGRIRASDLFSVEEDEE